MDYLSVRPRGFGRTEFRCGLYPRQARLSIQMLTALKSSRAVFCVNPDLVARFFALPLTVRPNYHGGAAFSYKLAGSILS